MRRWAWAAGIDLRDDLDGDLDDATVDRYVEHCAEQSVTVTFGADPCPACGGPGYLDHIDLPRQAKNLFCRGCRTAWVAPLA